MVSTSPTGLPLGAVVDLRVYDLLGYLCLASMILGAGMLYSIHRYVEGKLRSGTRGMPGERDDPSPRLPEV